jgi:RHS repeat-associated protein
MTAASQFTGKERDSETGLDYFGARYFSSAQGRFTAVDMYGVDQHPEEPQSWNLYSYARNNPLAIIDPSGEYVCSSGVTSAQCGSFQGALDRAQELANAIKDQYGADSKRYTDAQRAIDVYGSRGVDNGVIIKIDKDLKYAGETLVSGSLLKKTVDNPTGQDIAVVLRPDSVGRYETDAHEGSHAADGADWIGSGFAPRANPTDYGTEFRAFMVGTSLVAADNSYPNLLNRWSVPYEPSYGPEMVHTSVMSDK